MDKDKVEKVENGEAQECGHSGKYLSNGQNALVLGSQIVVITSSVCGECGLPTLSVNKIQLEVQPKPQNPVITPANGLIKRG